MEWIRLSTAFHGDERILDLIERRKYRAVIAFVSSMTFCGQQEKAFFHRAALSQIHCTKADADELVRVGLWEAMPTGYAIPNFEKYQLTNVTSGDRSQKNRENACKRWHSQPCERPACRGEAETT